MTENEVSKSTETNASRRRSKRLRDVGPTNYFPKRPKLSTDKNNEESNATEKDNLCIKCGMSIEGESTDNKCAECASDGTYEPKSADENMNENDDDVEDEEDDGDDDKNSEAINLVSDKSDDDSDNFIKTRSSLRVTKRAPRNVKPKRKTNIRIHSSSDEDESNLYEESSIEDISDQDDDNYKSTPTKKTTKKSKSNLNEEPEILQCEYCKSTTCDEVNKMFLCLSCYKCYHINCLVSVDVPNNLVFDEKKIVGKKLGCIRCKAIMLPYKVSQIFNWRWRDEVKDNENREKLYNSREYFVHYRTLSYWECTWVSEVQLDIFESNLFRFYKKRKLENDDDDEEMNEKDESEADAAVVEKQLESPKKMKENKSDIDQKIEMLSRNGVDLIWLQPHRILDVSENYVKCYVKWRNRDFDYSTYELLSNIDKIPGLKEMVTKWKIWKKELCDSSFKPKPKTKIKKITNSPVYLGPQNLQKGDDPENRPKLHDYQLEGLNWLRSCYAKNTNTILADEMGLGKTVQAISLLYSLYKEGISRGPYIIVVPLSTIINWEREIAFWSPDFNALYYYGSKESRRIIREYDFYFNKIKKQFKFHVLVTTYELIMQDDNFLAKVPWEILVIDEAHRLKSNASKLFKTFQKYTIKYRLLMTGTPLQNNLEELFHLLNFMEPNAFQDINVFMSSFQDVSKEEQVRNLQDMLKIHLLRRLKEDVFKDIPIKEEQIVRVELTPEQKEIYKMILAKNYAELVGKFKTVKLTNIIMQLRKCCNHPYLVPSEFNTKHSNKELITASGKMILLRKMLEKLIQRGHKVLIFSTMKIALNMIEYLLEDMQINYERIDGDIGALSRQDSIDRFNDSTSSSKVFLLSTKAGGLGINLVSADTVFIYDSDWNPHNDIQALSRAHRIGQKKKVMIYRFVMRNSVEEKMIETAKRKMMITSLVTSDFNKKEFHEILSFGTKELFCEGAENKAITYDDNAIETLLDRNREVQSDKKDDILSSCFGGFKVANYEFAEDEVENKETEENNKEVTKEEDPKLYWEQLLKKTVAETMKEELEQQQKQFNDLGKGKRKRTAVTLFVPNQTTTNTTIVDDEDSIESDSDDSEYKADSVSAESSLESLGDDSTHEPELTVQNGNDTSSAVDQITKDALNNALLNRESFDSVFWGVYGMNEGLLKKDIMNMKLYKNVIKRNDFCVIDGFYPRERMEIYKALMNFGIPSKNVKRGDRWWPDELQHKRNDEVSTYLTRLMNNLIFLPTSTNNVFKDFSPKDDIDYDLLMTRIGLMSLINFKVNYYESDNDDMLQLLLDRKGGITASLHDEITFSLKLSNLFKSFQIYDGGFTEINDDWLEEQFKKTSSNEDGAPKENGLSDDSKNNEDFELKDEDKTTKSKEENSEIEPMEVDSKEDKKSKEENSEIEPIEVDSKEDKKSKEKTTKSKEEKPEIEPMEVDSKEDKKSKEKIENGDKSKKEQDTIIPEKMNGDDSKLIKWDNMHDFLLLTAVSLYGYDKFLDQLFHEHFLSGPLMLPFRSKQLDKTKDNKRIRELLTVRLSILERALLIEAQLVKICVLVDNSMTESFPLHRIAQLHSFFKSQALSELYATTNVICNIARAKALCMLELLINNIGKVGHEYCSIQLHPSMSK